MGARRRRSAIALAAVLAFAGAPASAVETTLSSDDVPGALWAAYRVSVAAGTTVSFDVLPELLDARRYGAGMWMLKADGSLATAFVSTGFSGVTRERHVALAEPIGVVHHEHSGGMWGRGGISGGVLFNKAGEYVFVLAAVSDGIVRSGLALRATDGGTLLGKRTGTDIWLRTDTDFEGAANVYVSESCVLNFSPLCPTAKAMAAVGRDETLDGRFFGTFAESIDPLMLKGYRGPDGVLHLAGGTFTTGGWVFSGAPPGAYRFDVYGNAGTVLSGFALWGAGVELP